MADSPGPAAGLLPDVIGTMTSAGRCSRHFSAKLVGQHDLGQAAKALNRAAGRAGSIPAAELQAMHQVIYQILRGTGRRPGEVVSLRTGCVEVTRGQHTLIYDTTRQAGCVGGCR